MLFLKLQFPTKILALSIKKTARLYDVAFSRTLFIDNLILGSNGEECSVQPKISAVTAAKVFTAVFNL